MNVTDKALHSSGAENRNIHNIMTLECWAWPAGSSGSLASVPQAAVRGCGGWHRLQSWDTEHWSLTCSRVSGSAFSVQPLHMVSWQSSQTSDRAVHRFLTRARRGEQELPLPRKVALEPAQRASVDFMGYRESEAIQVNCGRERQRGSHTEVSYGRSY